MNSNLLKTTLVAAAGLLFANSTLAATATTTFQVTATVAESCKVTAGNLDFGAYDPLSATARDGSSVIKATCTKGTDYTIGLDQGNNTSGTVRRMANGGEFLSYELYSDSGRTTAWSNSTVVSTAAATGGEESYTVYGKIPPAQFVTAGSYADTVTVTVTY